MTNKQWLKYYDMASARNDLKELRDLLIVSLSNKKVDLSLSHIHTKKGIQKASDVIAEFDEQIEKENAATDTV